MLWLFWVLGLYTFGLNSGGQAEILNLGLNARCRIDIRRYVRSGGTRRANPCSLRCARVVTPAAVLPVLTCVRAGAVRVQPHRPGGTRGRTPAQGALRALPSWWSARWGPGLRPSGCRPASPAPSGGSAGRSLAVGPRLRRPALALRTPAAGSAGPGARQCPLRSPRRAGANGESARGRGKSRRAAWRPRIAKSSSAACAAEGGVHGGAVVTKPAFAEIWSRLMAQADRPFLTDGGHEFTYQLAADGAALQLSHRGAVLSRFLLEKAWAAMPCPPAALPPGCKPKGYVWTLLHDTRIAGTGLLAEIPPALAAAAKQPEKSAAELRPKRRKRRSPRAVRRAQQRARANSAGR